MENPVFLSDQIGRRISSHWWRHSIVDFPYCKAAALRGCLWLLRHGLWGHFCCVHLVLHRWGDLGDQSASPQVFQECLELSGCDHHCGRFRFTDSDSLSWYQNSIVAFKTHMAKIKGDLWNTSKILSWVPPFSETFYPLCQYFLRVVGLQHKGPLLLVHIKLDNYIWKFHLFFCTYLYHIHVEPVSAVLAAFLAQLSHLPSTKT